MRHQCSCYRKFVGVVPPLVGRLRDPDTLAAKERFAAVAKGVGHGQVTDDDDDPADSIDVVSTLIAQSKRNRKAHIAIGACPRAGARDGPETRLR